MSQPTSLQDAVRALKGVEAEHDLAELTEQRVLADVQRNTERARIRRLLASSLVAVVLTAGAAHAAVFGAHDSWRLLQRVWTGGMEPQAPSRPRPADHASPALRQAARVSVQPVPSVAHEAASFGSRAQPRASTDAATAQPSQVMASRASPAVAERSPRARRSASAEPSADLQLPRAADPQAHAEDAVDLYAEAHQLHFVLGDKHSALAAWNRYLAAQPNGDLAPEAYYNRALCLLAIGREAEAIEALEAIAAGQQAAYRARDAKRLLRALGNAAR